AVGAPAAAQGLREIGMDCEDVRLHLHDDQRGHLGPELHRELRTHLEGCPACAHEEAAEHMLTEVLERRLPQHPASLALKRRLLAQWPAAPVESRPWWRGWRRALVPALASALVLAVGLPLYHELWSGARGGAGYTSVSRGFNVILWRAGDLGYALVSDVDARELGRLAAKLARG